MPKRSKSDQESWRCRLKKIKQEQEEGDVKPKTETADNGDISEPQNPDTKYVKPKTENTDNDNIPEPQKPDTKYVEPKTENANNGEISKPKKLYAENTNKGDIPESQKLDTKNVKLNIENTNNGDIPKPQKPYTKYDKPKTENTNKGISKSRRKYLRCRYYMKYIKPNTKNTNNSNIPEPQKPDTKYIKPKTDNTNNGNIPEPQKPDTKYIKPKTENTNNSNIPKPQKPVAAEPSSNFSKRKIAETVASRANLRYSVCPKSGKVTLTKEIISLIKRKYDGESGIVYCFSNKDCKDVANAFVDSGLMAAPFCTDLSKKFKNLTEQNWLNDKVKIICATIGTSVFLRMNKPNVRFVLHHSLPKSITDYWQELGRAGRDGLPRDCILYLSHFDILRHRKIIEAEGLNNLKNDLDNIVKYCDNKSTCRQVQLFRLFTNTNFNKNCPKTCDNCLEKESYERYDATFIALKMVQSVKAILERRNGRSVTLVQCVNLFKGAIGRDLVRKGLKRLELPMKGQGISYRRDDVERFVRYLIFEHYLEEPTSSYNQPRDYLKLGSRAEELESGGSRMVVVDLKKISVNSSLPVLQRQTLE